jgi:hypothetical protein
MVQEIITYLIVASAIGLAVYKIYNKLKRKKPVQSANIKIESPATHSACSDCLAECVLRNTPEAFKNENTLLCERNIKHLKCS